jgi:hypothetical protein
VEIRGENFFGSLFISSDPFHLRCWWRLIPKSRPVVPRCLCTPRWSTSADMVSWTTTTTTTMTGPRLSQWGHVSQQQLPGSFLLPGYAPLASLTKVGLRPRECDLTRSSFSYPSQ